MPNEKWRETLADHVMFHDFFKFESMCMPIIPRVGSRIDNDNLSMAHVSHDDGDQREEMGRVSIWKCK